jgi:capsular exopolysaccharide synthesis family protein
MELRILFTILYRRRVIFTLVLAAFLLLVGLITLFAPKSYEATAKVIVENNDKLNAITEGLGLTGILLDTRVDDDVSFDTDLELLKIRPLVEQLIRELDLRDSDGEYFATDDFIDGGIKNKLKGDPSVAVKQYNFTALIRIRASSTSPEQAAEIANRLAVMYQQDRIARTSADYAELKENIRISLSRMHQDYLQSLKEYKEFRQRTGVVDMDTTVSNLLSQIVSLENNDTEFQRSIAVLRETIDAAREQLNKTGKMWESGQDIEQNIIATDLKKSLNSLSTQMAGFAVTLTTNHPDYKELTARLDAVSNLLKKEPEFSISKKQLNINPLYNLLLQAISNNIIELKGTLVRMETNRQQLEEYNKKLLALPALQMDDSKFSTNLTAISSVYSDLLQFSQEINLAEMATVSKIRLVEPANVPGKANFPKKKVNFILAVVFGSFFALVAALVVDYADNSLRNTDSLRRTDTPCFGSLPHSPSLTLRPALLEKSPVKTTEPLRALRDSLLFAAGEQSATGMFVVTSVSERGGASIIATGLARMLAERYGDTLLLEMNLRTPSLARLLKKTGSKSGVTDALTDNGIVEENSLQDSPLKGLTIMTAGSRTNDPARLLDSPALPILLNNLRQQFRYVIIDTPSPAFYHDAMLIAKDTDAVVLVARAAETTLDEVGQCLDKLRISAGQPIGTVLNCEGYSLALHRLPWRSVTCIPDLLRSSIRRFKRG